MFDLDTFLRLAIVTPAVQTLSIVIVTSNKRVGGRRSGGVRIILGR